MKYTTQFLTKYYLSFLRDTWEWNERSGPFFPPFNFSVHCQIVPSECQMSVLYGSVTPAVSSGSGTVGRRWPFRAHQGTDVSTLPWTGTIFRNMLQKRCSIKGDLHQRQGKPPVCSGHKINSPHSRRHWLGRWSFLIDSVQSSSFHKGINCYSLLTENPFGVALQRSPRMKSCFEAACGGTS